MCEIEPGAEHAQRVYDDSYFLGGGAGYPDYLGEAKLLIKHSERYGRLLSRYMQAGRVLDVGAAAGFIVKGLHNTGWVGMGIEPNARMADYGRSVLGVNGQTSTLEQLSADERFDLVSMIQVVAHFYDIRQAFKQAAAVTKPGGCWLIETWNKDSFVARALGPNWHEYSPPSVLHWFAPVTLKALAAQYGFAEIARGEPSKWLNGAHVKSLLAYKMTGSALQRPANALLRLLPDELPLPYPTFDLFWALYRKDAAPA
ncbi:MAG: class I SAM-dependent methyltransferase [Aggregatilineales bacterium]